METLLSVLLGISLSAATGFRIFLPPLIMSVMAQTTSFEPPANLAWLDNPVALFVLGVATAAEVLAYYIPWVDNLLDTLAAPAALIAGTLITYAFGVDLDPSARWALAIVAGGGAASGVQALTSVTRLISSGTTGGLGNPVVSTGENVAATLLSVLALLLPVLAFAVVVALLVLAFRQVARLRRRRRRPTA